ncbi:MAG: hypothetical protein WCN95_11760, partial [bacterium]
MKLNRLLHCIAFCMLTLIDAGPVSAETQSISFEGAKWIWFTVEPSLPPEEFPDGSVFFRGVVVLPSNTPLKSAEVAITCDNLFVLSINGKLAGESESLDSWNQPRRYTVTNLL